MALCDPARPEVLGDEAQGRRLTKCEVTQRSDGMGGGARSTSSLSAQGTSTTGWTSREENFRRIGF